MVQHENRQLEEAMFSSLQCSSTAPCPIAYHAAKKTSAVTKENDPAGVGGHWPRLTHAPSRHQPGAAPRHVHGVRVNAVQAARAFWCTPFVPRPVPPSSFNIPSAKRRSHDIKRFYDSDCGDYMIDPNVYVKGGGARPQS